MPTAKQNRRRTRLAAIDDPSTIWSTWVQSAEVLDVTRERRFRDGLRDLVWPVLGLRRGAVVVDVGCGTGALTRALARWMGPGCTVYGIDRDANFVAYAARRARETRLSRRLRYLQGDALALPLPDATAHAVISYTVVEHIPDHRAVMREQARVCRPGGRVSIISVPSGGGVSSSPPKAPVMTEREKELWKPLEEVGGKHIDLPWGIGKCDLSLFEIPKLLEAAGLGDIMIDAFCTVHAPDDARVGVEDAERYIDMEEGMFLGNAERLADLLPRPLPPGHLAALRRCIRSRFAKRRRYLRSGVRIWDYGVGVSLIVSGRKP